MYAYFPLQVVLQPAYQQAAFERGQGMFARMKDHVMRGVDQIKDKVFLNSANNMIRDLRKLITMMEKVGRYV